MNSNSSCIIEQFGRLVDLTDKEKSLLRTLEKDPKHYASGDLICEAGSSAMCFFTLQSGWAYSTRVLADGQRQVLDIFLPGQLMGVRDIGFNRSLSDFVALTDVEACPFPQRRITEVFAESPRLTDLLFLVLGREHAMLTERVINLGRRPAAQRLAHFILEMKVRLNQFEEEFELPLTQTIIGDALGLSSVHVSRTLKELRQNQWMHFSDGVVTINDLDAMVDFSGFNRTYLDSLVDWPRCPADS